MTVEEKIKAIILEIVDVDEKAILPNAHLRKDQGASSVDLVEILAAVENEFDLRIPDEDAPGLLTPRALCAYVTAKAA